MTSLNPCPLCGGKVHGGVYGGRAAFGCWEGEYEVECKCGLLWDFEPEWSGEEEDLPDAELVAIIEERGAAEWNGRTKDGTSARLGRMLDEAIRMLAEFSEYCPYASPVLEQSYCDAMCGKQSVDRCWYDYLEKKVRA